ncbi:MAG: TIGR02206 family membrane protein [Chloroflexi bacterium]|nr:TIGR02206 family membrane protein [Chloroflexota bacterium]
MEQDIINKTLAFYTEYITPYLIADYEGESFHLFDTIHFAVLGVILLIILLITITRKKHSEKNKENFRDTVAAILLVNEVSWHLWAYFYHEWTIQKMLPLHICSILIWLSAWMLIKKSHRIYEFAYFLGIGGALQAILTPDAGIYGFPHYRFFQTFIGHGFIIIAAIYMTLVEEMRPTWKSLLRVFAITNIYMVAVYFINSSIGSNYLYLNHKPPTASLLDMLPDWPIYLLYMEAIGIVTCLILYIPFIIKDWWDNRGLKEAGSDRLDNIHY